MAIIAQPSLRPSAKPTVSLPNLPKTSIRPANLQRRSTLKRSIDDTELMNLPSSPSKKSRVTFDTDVDIVSADDEDDLDPLLVKEQVRRAIERHIAFDHEQYEKIRSMFNTLPDRENAPSAKVLKVHLQALLANVSRLGRDCSGLVDSVLSSEWIGRDDTYIAFFVRFLGNLAAAQGGYINRIMGMLVEMLGPQKTRRIPETKVVREPKIHRRTLEAIRFVTQLVPTASGALADRIAAKLSFEFQKAEDRMTYIRNFMDLIQFVPELTSEILSNILRQLIKLDTSIQVELDEDETAEEVLMQHMSASQTLEFTRVQDLRKNSVSDEDDSMTSDDSDSEDETDLDPIELRRKQLKEDVRQVDMIMDILFRYYTEVTSSPNLQQRDSAVEQLIAQFNSFILPTYKSRHPQFLIFHFAQSDPALIDRFVTNCIGLLLEPRNSPVIRHTAAAYFSGFVGRGQKVSAALVQDCLGLLCDQLNDLRKKYEPQCRGPDIKRFSDFYSMFQAAMYIVCFRWNEINTNISDVEDDESDFEDIEPMGQHIPANIKAALNQACFSPLNPLRVCSPVIVDQFAHTAQKLDIAWIFSKIDLNKRVRLPTAWRSISDLDINQPERDMSWVGDNGMIEGYFPYDPYLLPISKHWIEGEYVDWPGIPGEEPEDSDTDVDVHDYDVLEEIVPDSNESGEE